MDLIGAGWTIDTDHLAVVGDDDHAVVVGTAAYMRELSDADLFDKIGILDYSGVTDWEPDVDEDSHYIESKRNTEIATEIRQTIRAGAEVSIEYGGRCTNTWDIPGTNLMFVYMGAGSWGDDPFEGFSNLMMFLTACECWPEMAEKVGFICGGLPNIDTMILHHTKSVVD